MNLNETIEVSIIVAAYNVEKFLPNCINSLIIQTFTNIEIIIVNDGSLDSSGNICDSLSKIDIRIKVIHQDNQGLVNARKAGLQLASGKYILFVDGDDYVEPNYCELLIKETIDFDPDIVIGGYIRNYRGRMISVKNNLPTGRYENEKMSLVWEKMIYTGEYFLHGISTYSWGKLFKRDKLLSIQMSIPSDITIGEDAAVVYPYLSKCNNIVISEASNYHYVQHQSSMLKISSDINSEITKLSSLFVFLLNFFKNDKNYDNYVFQLKPYILSQLMIRTGGLIKTSTGEMYLLGYKIDINQTIAIYNSGTFGQKIYYRLLNEGFKNIIWVDEDADLCNQDQLPVRYPNELLSNKIDKIFIASLNSLFIKRINNELIKLGFSKKLIYYFNNDFNIDELIYLYGINPMSFQKFSNI